MGHTGTREQIATISQQISQVKERERKRRKGPKLERKMERKFSEKEERHGFPMEDSANERVKDFTILQMNIHPSRNHYRTSASAFHMSAADVGLRTMN